jgi:hypothetical protein
MMEAVENETSKPLHVTALSYLLVAATLVLGVVAWLSLRLIMLQLAATIALNTPDLFTSQRAAIVNNTSNLIMVCGGIVWLGLAIAGIEYHGRNAGKRKSWKVLAWTLGIEIAVILFSLIV